MFARRIALLGPAVALATAAAFTLAPAWGQVARPPKASAAARPVVADGASFAEPKGWLRLDPDGKATKGWFLPPNSPPDRPLRTILVDVGKPTAPDARATAEGLAKGWGGAVVAEPAELDGVEAVRVRVDQTQRKPGLQPIEGLVVHRQGKAYLVMAGGIPGQSVHDELEEVRRGWKWVDQAK